MENKPLERVARAWPSVPVHKQVWVTAATVLLVFLFWLENAVMGGKKAPGILLLLVSVAYVLFALFFFRSMPEIVLVAGYILGAVHIAIFLISILTGGRKDK